MDASALESSISTAEKSLDFWSSWFLGATLVVVIGLVVEYFPNIRGLLAERPINRKLLVEIIGGALITIGVAGELGVQFFQSNAETSLRTSNHQYVGLLSNNIERVSKDAANAGVAVGALQEIVKQAQEQVKSAQLELNQMEDEIKHLETAQKAAPPAVTPPSVPNGAPRYVDANARGIIRSTTLPGAIVSIIPFLPGEPQNFANELGAAFSAAPGVQVAVGNDNFIMNGQRGLIVQYDHNNPVSTSVFDALTRARLNPIEGPATPGTSIVFIKVAPQ